MSCTGECPPQRCSSNTDYLPCHRQGLLEENAPIGGKFLQPPADLRQLRYVVAIAEEGSFTAAADRLQIAQQSLSQQIALVERRLGGALFDRGPRGVTLTVAGAALLPEARAVLVAADRAFAVARRAAAGERLRLRVGFLSSVANHLLPPVVRICRQRRQHQRNRQQRPHGRVHPLRRQRMPRQSPELPVPLHASLEDRAVCTK